MARLNSHELMHTLRLLTAEHRQVLALTYFGDLSQSQVADVTGVPPGAVTSRQSAALCKLRKAVRIAAFD